MTLLGGVLWFCSDCEAPPKASRQGERTGNQHGGHQVPTGVHAAGNYVYNCVVKH